MTRFADSEREESPGCDRSTRSRFAQGTGRRRGSAHDIFVELLLKEEQSVEA